jgi:hypothetical protein
MKRSEVSFFIALALAPSLAAPVQAVFDLRITEVWVGQDGSDLTEDWFEIRNYGDMAWTTANGAMTVNDNGGGLTTDVSVSGITEIQPGEMVLVLMEGSPADIDPYPEGDVQRFYNLWNPVKPQILANIGWADGGGLGLGAGGDSVNLYIGDVLEDTFTYTSSTSGVSMDVILGEDSFVGNASGAVATLEFNDMGEAAVGSPGSVVPEPIGGVLMIGGTLGVALVGRRRR